MMNPILAPYGSWRSPITAELITAKSTGLSQPYVEGGAIYWLESRAADGGRVVLVRYDEKGLADMTPAPLNVRTRVHEYGGGAFVMKDGIAFFSNFGDQHVYRQGPEGKPTALFTDPGMRYADYIVDSSQQRLIAVREDHSTLGGEPVNTIVSLDLSGGAEQVLVQGNDFYATPRLSPDGHRLAWLTWNHPNMPWDGTELWVGEVGDDGSVGHATCVAGGVNESIFQPEWSPDGVLYFVSDRSGWWNLYRWDDRQIESVVVMEAEFGLPQWSFGSTTYVFTSSREAVCTYTQNGVWRLGFLDLMKKTMRTVDSPYTELSGIRAGDGFVVLNAASPTDPWRIVKLDLATEQWETLRRSTELVIDQGYLSVPEAIEFPTDHGLTAYGFFYPPVNKDFAPPETERPPLLVISHGGPTGSTSAAFSLSVQYWTSRGFAILDVNYGGSTGYGRTYRERLNGSWGVVDVADCVNGAKFLADQHRVDEDRMAIRGGSAGGYTTLCALTLSTTFRAGASHFGISDLELLAQDTHKFESRYLDSMIGPYPERRDLYIERSPIHHLDGLHCPVIFLQGTEDKVVLPNQAERMVEKLREKGIPVAYVLFEGEGHGFRKAENVIRALESELFFYGKVFGFSLSDPIEPVEIYNM